jgi:hypothetical protein
VSTVADWRDIEAHVTAERHGLTPIARIPDPSSATIAVPRSRRARIVCRT